MWGKSRNGPYIRRSSIIPGHNSRLGNNIYTQIGLVLLIGLASKTAILLVEFAKQHHEEGHSIVDSAVAAAKLRSRPILMTALSFVFGVFPLVIATGAGAAGRRALGTAN